MRQTITYLPPPIGNDTPLDPQRYNAAMKNDPIPTDPYAKIADLYDLEHADYDEDIDFYTGFVESTGGPVLELGCGTGRLLVPIAAAGFPVTGVDSSATMLDRARNRVEGYGLQRLVTLHQASMTEADTAPGGPFGVAIIALNGLMHLVTGAAQRAALRAIHQALDPRGQLLIDLPNPTPDMLRAFDHSFTHEGTWFTGDGTRIDKMAARRLFPASQTVQTDLWYDQTAPKGEVRRTVTSYPMRYLYRAELELMLELAGFVEWQLYGSYDLDPSDDPADRLIAAAEVTHSHGNDGS
jgi:SAM-dependent methyltransferase